MLDEPDAANRLLVVEALGAIAPCGDLDTLTRSLLLSSLELSDTQVYEP